MSRHTVFLFFFFNDTATTEIYTLSLHDALPIYVSSSANMPNRIRPRCPTCDSAMGPVFRKGPRGHAFVRVPDAFYCPDRKSTRLNSSHTVISYAVFCLKKKKAYKRRHITEPTDQ